MGIEMAAGMQMSAAFYTRDKNPADLTEFGNIVRKRKLGGKGSRPLDGQGGDGAVPLASCRAGAKSSWSSSRDPKGEGLWLSGMNHNDLTCRTGNWQGACDWFGFAS